MPATRTVAIRLSPDSCEAVGPGLERRVQATSVANTRREPLSGRNAYVALTQHLPYDAAALSAPPTRRLTAIMLLGHSAYDSQ